MTERAEGIDEKQEEYFRYLDKLRDSGVTNMFGAPRYLQARFDLNMREAREQVAEWMGSFGRKP